MIIMLAARKKKDLCGGACSPPPEILGREDSSANEARLSWDRPHTPHLHSKCSSFRSPPDFPLPTMFLSLSRLAPPWEQQAYESLYKTGKDKKYILVLLNLSARTVHNVASSGKFDCGGDRLFLFSSSPFLLVGSFLLFSFFSLLFLWNYSLLSFWKFPPLSGGWRNRILSFPSTEHRLFILRQ